VQIYGNFLFLNRFFPKFYIFAPKFNTVMRYYEAIFKLTPCTQDACDLLAALASEAGFESFTTDEKGVCGYAQMDLFDQQRLDEILNEFPLPDVNISYTLTEMEDKDWNEQWEAEGFDPIRINDQCVIYDAQRGMPAFDDSATPTLLIAIEARQAFGTGNHETTRMVAATLMEQDLQGKRLLDCGCGTGILGIVAKKMGAEEVVAYDIDDWSVKNTLHNAELNDVEIEVLEGDKSVLSHINGLFDIVTANINRNILLDDMEAFHGVVAHGAQLILSGFYEEDAPILLEKAATFGWHEVGRKTDNNWCCLVLG